MKKYSAIEYRRVLNQLDINIAYYVPSSRDIQSSNSCIKCGGEMIGDGYTDVMRCEYVDDIEGYEPDAYPLYCDFEEEVELATLPDATFGKRIDINESVESETVQLINRLYWG